VGRPMRETHPGWWTNPWLAAGAIVLALALFALVLSMLWWLYIGPGGGMLRNICYTWLQFLGPFAYFLGLWIASAVLLVVGLFRRRSRPEASM
jgi:membrane protein implicated in regulation of membrane protease activity